MNNTGAERKEALARARRAAGEAAAARVEAGMLVGLGTGDTAAHAIRALAARGLRGLRCVATSLRTAELAGSLGLSLIDLDALPGEARLDLTIDGADEIDPELQLIKGGGGALLREKLVARASRTMIVIADASKQVPRLGTRWALPVELVPFAVPQTLERLRAACVTTPRLRQQADGAPARSDGGNAIADVPLPLDLPVAELHRRLKLLPGVIETGLFLCEATLALIGQEDGSVTTLARV